MIKEHHMKHHYKEPDAGFGFTSKIWDRVFKTDFQSRIGKKGANKSIEGFFVYVKN